MDEKLETNSGGIHESEVEGRPNLTFWKAQISAAKKAAKHHFEQSRDAWHEAIGFSTGEQSVKTPLNVLQPPVRYPIFWSSTRLLQPAYYSRTPVVVIEKCFEDLDDNVARVAATAGERLAKYLMRANPFDRVQYAVRDDFIYAGKATNRVCFESQISETPKKVYYVQVQVPGEADPTTGQPGAPVMVWQDSEGEPLPEGAKLQQDEQGVYAEGVEESIDSVAVKLVPLAFDDILHTPNARHWEEIDWIDFKSLLTKDDVRERFPNLNPDDVTYSTFTSGDSEDEKEESSIPTLYCACHEIWDKRKKKVYWWIETYNPKNENGESGRDEFADVKDDPYGLDGFFPCPPFMLGTCGPSSLYPIPDYIQLRPIIMQLHGMASRLKKLVTAMKRRGIYDSSVEELKALAQDTGEAEFIGVSAFQQQIVGKGGLENIIMFFKTEEFVAAVKEMVETIQTYEDKFNQLYGIPDLLRGVSDPNDTAEAQQLKGQFIGLAFSARQREMQRFVRDDIELMADLALKKFPESKLSEICGVKRMTPEDQQAWPAALLLLRDDDERKVRIDIETDSTITMNQNADIEQRNYLAKTLFEGIASVATASQQNEAFMPVAGAVLEIVISGLRQGKKVEESLRKAVDGLMQPKPPAPDPNQQKIQGQMQLKQMELQGKQALESQKLQGQMQLEGTKIQGKAQIEQVQAQADIATSQQQAQADMARENFKAHTKALLDEHLAAIDAKLEGFKAMLGAKLQAQQHAATMQHGEAAHSQAMDQHLATITAAQVKNAFSEKPPGA